MAVCARNNRDLERVREEFADNGWPLVEVAGDVGVRAKIERVVETIRDQWCDVTVFSRAAEIANNQVQN